MDRLVHELRYVEARMDQGLNPDEVRDELISVGWHRDQAGELVERFLSGATAPCSDPRPGPNLAHLPCRLSLDGRDVAVQLRLHRPQLCLLGNFLSGDECDRVIEEARPRLKRSKVLVAGASGDAESQSVQAYARTSEQTAFAPGASELLDRLRLRVALLTRWPDTHMESAQVAHYRPGADFAPHHDYFCPVAHRALIAREGQRIATVLVYLSTPESGGATAFTDVEVEVFPQKGSALVFAYPEATPASRTLHAGVPLGAGDKWIATFFLRDRAIAAGHPTAAT